MKTKALISCAVTVQLICVFVFAYGTFVFIDNSENIMAIISHFHCFRKGSLQIRGTVKLFFVSIRRDSLNLLLKYTI